MTKVWTAHKGWGVVLVAFTLLALAALAYAGTGPKFKLLFGMAIGQDPNNSQNDVITVTTTSTVIGAVSRTLAGKTQVANLTDELSLKYFFVGTRGCGGGSPRIQLAVALNGGPNPDHNAFGYVGTAPFGAGCAGPGVWTFNDFTDTVGRWDLSEFNLTIPPPACTSGNSMICTWSDVMTYFTTSFPNHTVVQILLADDSCSFSPSACGTADYDLLTFGNRTFDDHNDAEGQ